MVNKNSVLKYNIKFSKNEKKIAIIGLDGMSWPILEKFFEHRVMPALESIAEKSQKGILKSTIPPKCNSARRGETHLPRKVILKRNNWWPRAPKVLNYLDLPIPRDTDGLPIEGVSYGKES